MDKPFKPSKNVNKSSMEPMGFKTFIFNSLKIQLTISNNKQNNGNTESKLDL